MHVLLGWGQGIEVEVANLVFPAGPVTGARCWLHVVWHCRLDVRSFLQWLYNVTDDIILAHLCRHNAVSDVESHATLVADTSPEHYSATCKKVQFSECDGLFKLFLKVHIRIWLMSKSSLYLNSPVKRVVSSSSRHALWLYVHLSPSVCCVALRFTHFSRFLEHITASNRCLLAVSLLIMTPVESRRLQDSHRADKLGWLVDSSVKNLSSASNIFLSHPLRNLSSTYRVYLWCTESLLIMLWNSPKTSVTSVFNLILVFLVQLTNISTLQVWTIVS